ncbi:MAG TPA: ABC transporter ATP-binding protein [Bacillota bacterium]|nr:ABC transporter ATP-binding protein [Bacillota bacterium]
MSTPQGGRPSRPEEKRPPTGSGGWGRGGPMGLAMPVEKPKQGRRTALRLLGYFRPQALRLLLVLAAAILSTVFNILSPKVLGNVITALFAGFMARVHRVPGGGVNFHQVVHLLEVLTFLYVVSALFNWVQQFVMAGVAQRAVYVLRRAVMEKLTRLPVRFFDTHPHGEVLSRFINDFDNIASTLQQSLTQIITAVVTLVGVVVMMLTISPLLTVVTALTLPLSFVVTKAIATRSQAHFVARQKQLGALNGHVEEMYTGHVIVRAFGHEQQSSEEFGRLNDALAESTWKAQFITGMIMPMMGVIGNIGFVLVSVIGGLLVARGRMAIGDIQAFIQYARQFSQPITQLASTSNSLQSALASSERVFELLDEPEESPEPAFAETLASPQGHVAFADVDFRYAPDQPLIDDLSIAVRSGQTVAIVGPTGAGKTTLVNLLMRFYDVGGGAITVDGVDIRRMRRTDLRRLFGMVLQDTWLFHGTIKDNIAYGREGAGEHEVVAAAQAAHADHFIRTLFGGYETVLNEDASNISQGQRQLLAIARAILADPPILILDEATSSVDTRTEMAIQSAMRNLMRGRTSFVIAHRLSTIRDADAILVLQHGQVVQQGTHEELLERGGLYADLYNSQFAGAEGAQAAV